MGTEKWINQKSESVTYYDVTVLGVLAVQNLDVTNIDKYVRGEWIFFVYSVEWRALTDKKKIMNIHHYTSFTISMECSQKCPFFK